MTISTDLDAWWAEVADYNESNSAKAKFQDIIMTIDQMLNELQEMNAQGDFDKLPPSAKAKAIWIWQQLDAARNSIEADTEAMEFIIWRPQ